MADKPKTIVLVSVGSRGDVQPYCVLGQAMSLRGYNVVVATEARLESMVVDEFGLAFRRIVGDVCAGFFDPVYQKRLRSARFLEALEIMSSWNDAFDSREILQSYEAALAGADIIVSGVMSVTESYCIAEAAKNIAWVPVFLGNCALPTGEYPHWIFEDMMVPTFLACVNRFTYSLVFRKMWQKQQVHIQPWRVQVLGLPPITSPRGLLDELITSDSIPLFQACSLTFASPSRQLPRDYPPSANVTYTGFLFPTHEPPPSPALQAFIEDATAPLVYVGFGSMPTLEPLELVQLLVRVCDVASCRCVLAAGWTTFANDDRVRALVAAHSSTVFVVYDTAPHSWLFPKMRCVVHHAGIGTTGAALRSGVPQIPCPVLYDQFHNAKTLVSLGVAPSWVPQKDLNATLASAVQAVLRNDRHVVQAAAEMGQLITHESARAVETLCDGILAAPALGRS